MGLGLRISAELDEPGGALEQVASAIRAAVADPLDRLILNFASGDGVLHVRLHPAEEDVEFVLDGAALVVSAKTSSAGPGYHAWLVDLLEAIGQTLDIVWDWQDRGAGEGDETGYRGGYDFIGLQAAMAGWLRDLAAGFLEYDHDDAPIAISLPVGDKIVSDAYAVSSMGEWTRDWFTGVAMADDAELAVAAAEFFPAWHPRDDARYWLGCGLAMAWQAVRWTPPAYAAEQDLYHATLGCFARAHEIDPDITLPEAPIRELWALLNGGRHPAKPPAPTGVGFRRGLMARPLTGQWRAILPGYFITGEENEGQTVYYAFAERTMHGTSFETTSETGDSGERAVADRIAQTRGMPGAIDFRVGNVVGSATSRPDAPNRIVEGMVGCGDAMCLVSLVHEDTEDGQAWAEATLHSISHPERQAE